MSKKNILFLLFVAALLVSCGKQIPGNVIKPKKMEEILYDYHLCEAANSNGPYDETYKNEAYKELIFKKYKISKADFDSSLVWYTKNPQELSKIYTKIGEKFRNNNQRIENIISRRQKEKLDLSGKVVDIWNDNSLCWLTSSSLSNRINFEIVADTTYKENDRFVFNADYIFLSRGKQEACMGINVIFDNDSITGNTKVIKSNGHYSVSVNANGSHKVRSVNGFIYYKANATMLGVLANNIKLIRYHNEMPLKPEFISDTIRTIPATPATNVDTVSSTSVPDSSLNNIYVPAEIPVENKGDEVRERLRQRTR